MDQFQHEKLLLSIAGIFLAGSIVLHVYRKERYSLFALLLAAAVLFLFACLLDPFLNPWDERFHALVAKNLLHHPFLPTLYDKMVVNIAYDRWDRYHIWLHKQPLFLWQIALSYKLFGVNEVALRLPGALLCCLSVYALYRSGKILGNSHVGYYAAFLFTSSFYMLQLISGYQELDENDVSFIAYITLSIWTWLEYYHSGKKYWLVLTGIFSGCAILCKWFVGLLVYLGWGVHRMLNHTFAVKKYSGLFIALLITAAVVLPWQIFILRHYPAAARTFYDYSSRHFSESIEGHDGPWYYHFERMGQIFGMFVPYLIVPALVVFYFKARDKKMVISFLVMILFVYLFFSCAATKMPSFTAVLVAPVFISLAFLLDFITGFFYKIKSFQWAGKIALIVLLGGYAYLRIDPRSLDETHSIWSDETYCRKIWMKNKAIFQQLHLPANAVLFNVTGRNYIDAMFYTGIPSYELMPTEEQYRELKKQDHKIILFRPAADSIPAYLSEDPAVTILNDTINVCE